MWMALSARWRHEAADASFANTAEEGNNRFQVLGSWDRTGVNQQENGVL